MTQSQAITLLFVCAPTSLRRQFGGERCRNTHFCMEGVGKTLLPSASSHCGRGAVFAPSLSLCGTLLTRENSAWLSVALLPVHLALILLLNLCFFLQLVIFICREGNFFNDMSFTKTGKRTGGPAELYETHIMWILNLGLGGNTLSFSCFL